jgi:uncharacterized protein (TIGR02266 family)
VNPPNHPAPRYPASLKVALPGPDGLLSGEATNISATGMFVRTDTKLPVGAVVSVALALPDGDRPVPVDAKIIHVRTPSQSRATRLDPGVGVQFVGGDETFRARVNRYIESIPRESRVPSVRLLSMARELLRTHGWTQLLERDPGGSYCLTGALMEAAGQDDGLYRSALRAVGERLNVPACSLGGYGCHCAIVGWNDKEGRTKHEVIAKLDEVIRAELVASTAA